VATSFVQESEGMTTENQRLATKKWRKNNKPKLAATAIRNRIKWRAEGRRTGCSRPDVLEGYFKCEACYRSGFKSKYKVELTDFQEVVAVQGGVCAMRGFGVCSRSIVKVKIRSPLVPDHDHETGEVRMALCHGHNRALSQFGDTLAGVLRMVELLKNPPAKFLYTSPRRAR
jgi:hypothetical protein